MGTYAHAVYETLTWALAAGVSSVSHSKYTLAMRPNALDLILTYGSLSDPYGPGGQIRLWKQFNPRPHSTPQRYMIG